jgi:hypothetical protein
MRSSLTPPLKDTNLGQLRTGLEGLPRHKELIPHPIFIPVATPLQEGLGQVL